jgi:putative thioredoxin
MIIGQGKDDPNTSDLIKDGTDASFVKDVVEASKTRPVIVDFWATWCGPCKTLTPALEKAVLAAKGAVTLVKIDVDKNPGIAGQLRVQSIPTVYAFVAGRPVDAFQGAIPESQIKTFIDKLVGPTGAGEIDILLAEAAEALSLNDVAGAAQAYATILQIEPEHLKAIGGLARCYLLNGDPDQAAEIVALAPQNSHDPDLDAVRASLALLQTAPSETAPLEARLKADPSDHEARIGLANALAAKGKTSEAIDHLIVSIEMDRSWNEEAARKQLLQIIEAAGPGSPEARLGRRRLSAVLFS